MVLIEAEKPESKNMLNEIYRILSIVPSCLKTISRMMSISFKLIEAYLASEIEDFKQGAINELRIALTYLAEAKQNCRLS